MSAFLQNLRARHAACCRHGVRVGECQTCTPRKDAGPPAVGGPKPLPPPPEDIKGVKSTGMPMGPPGAPKGPKKKPPPKGPRKLRTPAGPLEEGSLPWHVYREACAWYAPFSLADLAVACWTWDRPLFGLAGYESLHPDVRKVACVVYGKRGLLARGLVRWVGSKFEAVKEPSCANP